MTGCYFTNWGWRTRGRPDCSYREGLEGWGRVWGGGGRQGREGLAATEAWEAQGGTMCLIKSQELQSGPNPNNQGM